MEKVVTLPRNYKQTGNCMKGESLTLALLTTAMLLAACKRGENNYQKEVLRVTTETINTCSTTSNSRSYIGKVEEESSTPVSFTGMGTVGRICVEEGQYVKKGQLIAEMDQTQCENTRQAAKAALDQALDAQERMQVLHASQSISDMDWVNVQTKVRQAQASLDMAEKAVKDCRLLAPCSGIIGKTASTETAAEEFRKYCEKNKINPYERF